MSMAEDSKPGDYYPLRWKIADTAEDLYALHRGKAIALLALAGSAFILLGFVLFGWGASTDDGDLATGSPTSTPSSSSFDGVESSSSSTSSTAPPTTSEVATTTTAPANTEPAVSPRAASSDAELAATEAGAIVEMTPTIIRVIGGMPDDDAADDLLDLAREIFAGLTVQDEQVVDEFFVEPQTIMFRLSAPDLFGYNRDALNPSYLPLLDRLAARAVRENWSIEVSGHTDDDGPAPGNQLLSEGRAVAAAQRLIEQGVPSNLVSSIGRGEDDPVASNETEAGRLANRRVEFDVLG
jgi:outer membrane protein OmpA-like peptidoglycan-associated protein